MGTSMGGEDGVCGGGEPAAFCVDEAAAIAVHSVVAPGAKVVGASCKDVSERYKRKGGSRISGGRRANQGQRERRVERTCPGRGTCWSAIGRRI